MSHKKQDLRNLSLNDIKKENRKTAEVRKDEIDSIKHQGKKILLSIFCNPLTGFMLIAFLLLWFYYKDARIALQVSSTYLLEYFIIRHLDKK
jgi:hypothetical protein